MAYNIRQVVDNQNVIQAMPPERKTFGYGLGIAKGVSPNGTDILVEGPYTSIEEVMDAFGSNSEIVRVARTYFSGGYYGKPAQFYVAYADTETLDSLNAWVQNNQYAVGDKVRNDNTAYICTFPHTSSGTFGTDMWKSVTQEEASGAEEWASDTQYQVDQYVKVTTEGEAAYYQCVFAHTSGEEFTMACWEVYQPTGRDVADIMTDLLQSKDNFYILLPTKEFDVQQCLDMAAAVEASSSKKTIIFTRSDSEILVKDDSTDLASKLKALKYDRSMVIYDPLDADGNNQYVNAAVASGYATVDFTTARPMLVQADKVLKGVVSLDLKSDQYSVMSSKYCNFYTKTTDIDTDMFIDAKMSSGQFFDTIQCGDWLAYNLTYEIVKLLQSTASIPFNDDGFKLLYAAMERVAVKAMKANVIGSGYDSEDNYIENGYSIYIPALSEIDKTDKAQRILRGVENTFLMAGSMQRIVITNDIQL